MVRVRSKNQIPVCRIWDLGFGIWDLGNAFAESLSSTTLSCRTPRNGVVPEQGVLAPVSATPLLNLGHRYAHGIFGDQKRRVTLARVLVRGMKQDTVSLLDPDTDDEYDDIPDFEVVSAEPAINAELNSDSDDDTIPDFELVSCRSLTERFAMCQAAVEGAKQQAAELVERTDDVIAEIRQLMVNGFDVGAFLGAWRAIKWSDANNELAVCPLLWTDEVAVFENGGPQFSACPYVSMTNSQ